MQELIICRTRDAGFRALSFFIMANEPRRSDILIKLVNPTLSSIIIITPPLCNLQDKVFCCFSPRLFSWISYMTNSYE